MGWSAYIIWQVDRGRKGVNDRIELITRIGWVSGEIKEMGIYLESDSAQTQQHVERYFEEHMDRIDRQLGLLQDQELVDIQALMGRVDSVFHSLDWAGQSRQELRSADMDVQLLQLLEDMDDANTLVGIAIGRWSSHVNSYWNQLYFLVFISCMLGLALTFMVRRQRKSTQALERARDEAEKAARIKSDFLAMMSHEIRTPLNAVIGMSDLIMETELDDEQEEYVRTIKIGGENLLSIINDVLDYSKMESGRMEIEEESFDLSELVQDVFDLFKLEAAEKDLNTAWQIAPDVPSQIVTDKVRLRQVLLNLIGNALKFTEEGEVQLNVENCGQKGPGQCIRFAVSDTGIGISEEKQKELFQSFSQVDSSRTRSHGGTGLGLAICRSIVEMMGGEVDVDSREGEGSTFYFHIMVDAEEKPRTMVNGANNTGSEMPAGEAGLPVDSSILVVEDNRINQLVTQKMLEKLGYQADVASNGLEAVEAVGRKHYELVFMDLQMPEMDGFESTARIRSMLNGEGNRTRIIAMTADTQPLVREKCLQSGMDDYLSKPVQMNDLRQVVDK
ncbi:MAG: ATP-binding protein [Balneolaceae bacterium]|nr:ATP-binding protein [Balneolaceae bacterium]